jgi:glycosyltransferase involved in cell wall biosynthesis/tetratricopeptide (TPR) repeat protein
MAVRLNAAWPSAKRLIRFILPARRKVGRLPADSLARRLAKLRQAGKFDKALAVFERATAEVRSESKVRYEHAWLLAEIGELNAAYAAFMDVLALDPDRPGVWKKAGTLLTALGRGDELPALVGKMRNLYPRNSEWLIKAATIATDGGLHRLADELMDEALSPSAAPNLAAALKGARILLRRGAQGRVVHLFDRPPFPSDGTLHGQAAELKGLALAQLRLAGADTCAPVGAHARADVIAVRSILERMDSAPAGIDPAGRGLAIVANSLAPGGAETQAVRLVRELCAKPRERVGPIFLLLGTRSRLAEPDFHADSLAGLKVTVECLSDFDLDVGAVVPAGIAGQLSILPPRMATRTTVLIDRLRTYRPHAVLAMSETNGLAAGLAAAITAVPRVVVSVRGEPPPVWGVDDSLLRPAYQSAVAGNRLQLVANGSATARAFAQWLEQPRERVTTIYNGIDVDELLSQRDSAITAAHRRALGIREGAPVIGTIFNARPDKRPRLWVEAAAVIARRRPDAVFVVVGADHRRNFSPALMRSVPDGRFHRPGIRRDVPTWLDLMDVVLLTSQTEGTPNALIEAQALGRPVVATGVASSAETFLPGRTGILLPANPTPDDIAEAVLRVLDDPGFACRARDQAPGFIRQRFDLKRMASEFVDICFGPEKSLRPISARPETEGASVV